MQLTLEQIYQLSLAALSGSGASEGQAAPVADSIREAEAEGIRNVGLGYLPIYCEHLRCGKVKGDAVPRMVEAAPAVLRVDAGHGFCHPAFLLALPRFTEMAEASGVGIVTIRQFELGRTSPRASTLRAIANALKRKGVILLDGSSPGVRMRAPPARVGIAEAQTNLMLQ